MKENHINLLYEAIHSLIHLNSSIRDIKLKFVITLNQWISEIFYGNVEVGLLISSFQNLWRSNCLRRMEKKECHSDFRFFFSFNIDVFFRRPSDCGFVTRHSGQVQQNSFRILSLIIYDGWKFEGIRLFVSMTICRDAVFSQSYRVFVIMVQNIAPLRRSFIQRAILRLVYLQDVKQVCIRKTV